MMNYDPSDTGAAAAAGPWSWCCYNDDNAGEAAAVPTTGESSSFFADMVAAYSTYDVIYL